MRDDSLDNTTDLGLVESIAKALSSQRLTDTFNLPTHLANCDNPDCPICDAIHMMKELVLRVDVHPELAPIMGVIERAIDAVAPLRVTGSEKDGRIYVDQFDGPKYLIKVEQVNRDEDA